MTRFDDMPAGDLRAELADWNDRLEMYARQHLAASASGDVDWERDMRIALEDTLARVRRLKRLLKLGAVA